MAPSSASGRIDIYATTRKIDVDNRISLRFYCRIADNILKQADIFRQEKNIVDLYVMLIRFSSLVTETIPCHRDYRTYPQGSKLYLKKKLITALTELEELKPVVQAKIQELHHKQSYQLNKQQPPRQNDTTVEWPTIKQNRNDYNTKKGIQPVISNFGYQGPKALPFTKPIDEYLSRISLSVPPPKAETLSKHSILGPNGLYGQWQRPSNYKVQYPSNADFKPLQISSIATDPSGESTAQPSIKDGAETMMGEEDGSSEQEKLSLESIMQPKTDDHLIQEPDSLISFGTVELASETEIVGQPPRPPVLADVQDLIPTSNSTTATELGSQNASDGALGCAEDPLQLHIPTELMNCFMKLAKSNTDKNLETCGVLAGSLRERKFYITALIIPKQESTSDSCQTTNEEEIFEVQDKRSLFPLGWIHTHPTQSCFMSSIDVHTHYSYQIMLPEAIAIVMAPKDASRKHGIFRLTPGGMTVIRQCPRRGFHSHEPPSDGSPIYRHCTDVYMNSGLKFDVIDLR